MTNTTKALDDLANGYAELAKGSGAGGDAEERRTKSIATTWSKESEQFLADVDRAEKAGLTLSPTMTLARAYAQGASDAAKKAGIDTNTTNEK